MSDDYNPPQDYGFDQTTDYGRHMRSTSSQPSKVNDVPWKFGGTGSSRTKVPPIDTAMGTGSSRSTRSTDPRVSGTRVKIDTSGTLREDI